MGGVKTNSLLERYSYSSIHGTIRYYCLLLIVVALPFSTPIASAGTILLGAHWLIEGRFRQKYYLFKHNYTAQFFIGLYLLNVLSILYTADVKSGTSDLETKLSLIVMPLILGSIPAIGRERVEQLLWYFIAANVAGSLFCLGGAVYHYYKDQTAEYFFYHSLSEQIGIHAIYFSMYLSFCLFVVLNYLVSKWRVVTRGRRIVGIVLISFLLGIVMLLSSKTILLSLLLFLNVFFVFYFLSNRKQWKAGLLLIVLNFIIVSALIAIPYTRERFKNAFQTDLKFMQEGNYDIYYTGLSLRIVIWKFSFEILNEQKAWLHGVGTGDAQTLLDDKYRQYHLYTGNPTLNDKGYLGYNAHNQYIQFLLCLGVVGLLYFLLYLAIPIKYALQRKDYLFLAFVFFFGVCCLTESILARQKGIAFYALFSSLFMFHRLDNTGPTIKK